MRICNVSFRIVFLSGVAIVMILSAMAQAQALTVFMRPDGLGSGNNWSVGTFDDINESGRDDSDFVTSNRIGGNQQDFVVFSLSDEVDPVVDIDHIVRYVYKEDGTGSSSPRLEVTLQQGETNLITWTEDAPLPGVFTLATHEIPTSVVSQIGNYNDLRLEFRARCSGCPSGGGGAQDDSVSVSWAELQYETYTTPRDHLPPKITGIGFYKIEPIPQNNTSGSNFVIFSNYSKYSDITDPQNYGKYKKSGKFYDLTQSIPTFGGNINERIQTQIKLQGVFASTRIEHLSLISTNTKSDFKSSNFEIIADKGKKPMVIDQNKILKNVQSTYSLEDGNLWINLDLMFQKPLKKSNLVLQIWDEMRIPVYAEISDAWEISDPSKIIVPVVKTFDRALVIITQKTDQSVCKDNNSCYVPSEITIRKGGSIVWKNEDSIIHTIVSGTPKSGPDNKFNFAVVPQRSHENVFPFAGTYAYYCSLHPWYVGTVIVSEDLDESKIQKYSDFKVTVLSTGDVIANEQIVLVKDRNTNVLLTGYLPNIKKPTTIDILIKRPDKSVEDLSIKTTKDGDYLILIKLAEKWKSGKFEIIGKQKDHEIGHVNFTMTDKLIKSKKR